MSKIRVNCAVFHVHMNTTAYVAFRIILLCNNTKWFQCDKLEENFNFFMGIIKELKLVNLYNYKPITRNKSYQLSNFVRFYRVMILGNKILILSNLSTCSKCDKSVFSHAATKRVRKVRSTAQRQTEVTQIPDIAIYLCLIFMPEEKLENKQKTFDFF